MIYYNDNDPFCVSWLRELIKEGLLPKGDVDERSIVDIKPKDLKGYGQCHFFAGIGGWPYALSLAGWGARHPVWTGSCPCQPFSVAGKGEGEKDERHLWPAFYRLIMECNPPTIFGEQVASALGREWLAGVRLDFEALGYAVGAADLCAAGVGAPHIRQRLFWVADRYNTRPQGRWQHGERADELSARKSGTGGGMAYAEPQHDRSGESGTGRRIESANSGTTIVVADAERNGWRSNEQVRKPKSGVAAWRSGEGSRMGNTECDNKRREREPGSISRQEGEAGGSGPGIGGVGVSDSAGPQPGREPAEAAGYGRAVEPAGFWDDSIWHLCSDGKARRISPEPALFPLAPRVSNQVGTLRGAGNSIVPQIAAEFIKAFMVAVAPSGRL